MITHILKLIWKKKGTNSLMILEILLSFLVLFAVLSFVFYNTDRLAAPIGFETEQQSYILFRDLSHFDSIERSESLKSLKRNLEEMELVESVGFSNGMVPFSGSMLGSGGRGNGFHMWSRLVYVDLGFAETNDLDIIEGRWFAEEDFTAAYPPIIVNKKFMDEYYSDRSMVDSIIMFKGQRRIVGVMEDYRYGGEFEELTNTMLMLVSETHEHISAAYVKLSPSADVAYEEKINNVVQSTLKTTNFVIQNAQEKRDRANRDMWIPIIALLSICGFLCLNVALGLFGVLSYQINKRRSEVGLRRALGAHTTSIASQFMLEIVMLAGFALVIGVFFAIQIPLLKVIPIESWIFYRAILVSVAVILIIVTLCSLYPSSQAAKIHPAIVLHED